MNLYDFRKYQAITKDRDVDTMVAKRLSGEAMVGFTSANEFRIFGSMPDIVVRTPPVCLRDCIIIVSD